MISDMLAGGEVWDVDELCSASSSWAVRSVQCPVVNLYKLSLMFSSVLAVPAPVVFHRLFDESSDWSTTDFSGCYIGQHTHKSTHVFAPCSQLTSRSHADQMLVSLQITRFFFFFLLCGMLYLIFAEVMPVTLLEKSNHAAFTKNNEKQILLIYAL